MCVLIVIFPLIMPTFFAQDRVVTEEAFAGDIIGLHTHSGLKVGDTLTQGEVLKFTGIPALLPNYSVELDYLIQ